VEVALSLQRVVHLPLSLSHFVDLLLDGGTHHQLQLLYVLDLLPAGTRVNLTPSKLILLPENRD
jgi:hypothetical protein